MEAALQLNINWDDVTTQVVATVLAAGLLGTLAWVTGVFRWIGRFFHRPRHAPEAPTTQIEQAIQPMLIKAAQPLTAPQSTPSVDAGTEREIMILFARAGRTSIESPVLATAIQSNEIRLKASVTSLASKGLLRIRPANWVNMTHESVSLTERGAQWLIDNGLA